MPEDFAGLGPEVDGLIKLKTPAEEAIAKGKKEKAKEHKKA
ncbi:17199_t:CDS:2, partial [Entrophospora sp. SA101]